jgi:hypothetical protein
MRAALLIALAGCYATPHVAAPPTAHTRVGCFDVDVVRTSRVPSPVFEYHFTNACDHEATANVAGITGVAVTSDGAYHQIDMGGHRHERFLYRIDPHDSAVAERATHAGGFADDTEICVDLGTADDGLAYAAHWTCVHY